MRYEQLSPAYSLVWRELDKKVNIPSIRQPSPNWMDCRLIRATISIHIMGLGYDIARDLGTLDLWGNVLRNAIKTMIHEIPKLQLCIRSTCLESKSS